MGSFPTHIVKIIPTALFIAVGWTCLVASASAQTEDQNGIYVNKRPLKDWSKKFAEVVSSKNVDLNSPFAISISAILGLAKDGKTIILEHPKLLSSIQPKGSDPVLVKLVEDAVMSAGDSGWFGYFNGLNREKSAKMISLLVQQDSRTFSVNIDYVLQSSNDARTMSSAFSMLISLGQMQSSNPDDKLILSGTSVSSEESVLKLRFSSSKEAFWEMVKQRSIVVASKTEAK
jgi:hypothetical protein